MKVKGVKKLFTVSGVLGLAILIGLISDSSGAVSDTSDLVTFQENRLTLKAEKKPLGDVLDEIEDRCGVEILGLDERTEEPITFFSEKEPLEKALKRLLRHLEVRNYAFEYTRTQLRRISVLPESKTAATSVKLPPPPRTPPKPAADEKEKVVRVVKVQEDSQAEGLDLRTNDIILEYDGARIRSAQQLVSAVKKKTPEDTVEMVVVRERQPFRLVLNGGLIGVNIVTVSVAGEELGL
ncbi:hypothetical protein DENIS_0692 [Desulfonema ishimotonii]|uniref:PDZ domain-containing protein n=1 Tax=Desulfonema ishimotonii TaxID=45657 RepID=A0A401FS05_9BACT|nr:PDZ domain-containing protein [Desulfonema ishimotonii]GBC59751.1 hypothetical protein DENIS_0692 [Desulfonema ishimotonii]